MKVCKKCGISKDESEFGVHKGKDNGKGYLKGNCKKCDAAYAREKSKQDRSTPEGRAKHNKWAREGHRRNREKNILRMREVRKTAEHKAYIKAYRKKNKEKIYQQEVLTKKKYHEKNRDNITDKYCIRQLVKQKKTKESDITESMIDAERLKIILSRLNSKINQVSPAIGEFKKCTCCHVEKDLSEFYLIKKKNIRMPACKICSNLKCKRYRDKNKLK